MKLSQKSFWKKHLHLNHSYFFLLSLDRHVRVKNLHDMCCTTALIAPNRFAIIHWYCFASVYMKSWPKLALSRSLLTLLPDLISFSCFLLFSVMLRCGMATSTELLIGLAQTTQGGTHSITWARFVTILLCFDIDDESYCSLLYCWCSTNKLCVYCTSSGLIAQGKNPNHFHMSYVKI